MFNILTLNKISDYGLKAFDKNNYTCGEGLANPDAVIVRSASMLEMDIDKNIAAIARAGAGYNNIPVEQCSEKGIVVYNTPGANANAVKELVLCALLMTSRDVAGGIDWCKTLKGQGAAVSKLVEKGKGDYVGPEIFGKTLGLAGLGAIGNLVANAAVSLGMKVIGYDPYLSVRAALELDPKVKLVDDLNELFEESDYISIHAPLTPETKGMVNADSLSIMKNGVRILNFARAELVEEFAIIDALNSGKAAAYATDFPTDAQIGVKGVIAIPHLGASTPESEDNCALMAVNQIAAFLEKGDIINSVNFPNMKLPQKFETRVCILHKERDGILADITKLLPSDASIMSNVRKGLGYTVADISGSFSADAFTGTDGVLKVRVLSN